MARRVINTGATPNDGTGDSFRTMAEKVNDNFAELYDTGAKPRKGFSINGWVFLLALLSLFAGFYYLGGIKSRQERDTLTLEALLAKAALINYCLILEQQNMVIAQQDSIISTSRREVMEYSWLYQKAVKGELAVRRKYEAYKDSIAAARPTQQLWWYTDDGCLPWNNIDPGVIELDSITLPSWWK